MKVKELIEKLKLADQDSMVVVKFPCVVSWDDEFHEVLLNKEDIQTSKRETVLNITSKEH